MDYSESLMADAYYFKDKCESQSKRTLTWQEVAKITEDTFLGRNAMNQEAEYCISFN